MDDLACTFDFDLGRASRDSAWITLVPQQPFAMISGESAGGVFIAYGDEEIERRPILYATSEGQAGCIAADLPELIALMMAAPWWQDVLKFSNGGSLTEMRTSAALLDQDYLAEYGEIIEARDRIMAILPTPAIADPVKLLHERVLATDCTLAASDGRRYETLFGTFKASDNPFWR